MARTLLEARGLLKTYGERKLLDIPELLIREGDRIGLVGANGSGKTTLLQILSGELSPDAGSVRRLCPVAVVGQLADSRENLPPQGEALSRLGVSDLSSQGSVSGGEAVRLRIAAAFSTPHALLLCDEPTANLDLEGVAVFCQMLERESSFLLISHDRELLERHCNRIASLEKGELTLFDGKFSQWQAHKEALLRKQQEDYLAYQEEKRRLLSVYEEKMRQARQITKKAKGRSSSDQKAMEFGRVNRSFGGKERNLHRAAKVAQERIQRLEAVEKPKALPEARFDFSLTDPPANRIVLRGGPLSFSYGKRQIFSGASFEIPGAARSASAVPMGRGNPPC